MDNNTTAKRGGGGGNMAFSRFRLHRLLKRQSSRMSSDRHGRDSRLLGALAAAAAFLLSVDAGRDGAGQGYGADGAARHLSAGHLLLDRWRWTGGKKPNNR